ncbi:hypothetical protein ASPVEDRAFT_157741 [Aspergillus versicolor CBS 583.65]|uniref:chitinase n=1 Tax=Aspergillus versicolor CBS 583.65 TaxID=1036611 RepID=A0A1L9P475_ASPVE|nr:uncharacterized protein ASPVEDRAFT_157741 [Aspergillus versicolor CBS 583.65]OJI96321.1 hypothetical protein ASPVEDRAFT_157741 [Aspergillus versicolor CBS 583.65]
MFSSGSIFPHWRRKAAERSSGSSSEIPFFLNAAYYPNWRIYRKQPPSSLRLGFVSHIFYAFAWVREDGTVYLSDEWADTQMPVDGTNGCLRAFAQLKQQYSKMKLVLSIGGGGKGSENFAAVARSKSRTETFAQSARQLVDQFGLDGIDVDWEHPADSQQGHDYIRFLSRLRDYFPAAQYVLATCLPAGQWALQHIDLKKAQKYVDMINVMGYDFAGPWGAETGHHAQLYSHTYGSGISCQSAVEYFLGKGVHPKKLLLGIPAYGRSFLGSNNIGQRYVGCGGEDGVFDYSELPRPGAMEYHDNEVAAAFCVGGDGGFVTYDTPQTVEQKAKFVTRERLGGLFYWHIGGDARGPRSLIETGYNTLHDM